MSTFRLNGTGTRMRALATAYSVQPTAQKEADSGWRIADSQSAQRAPLARARSPRPPASFCGFTLIEVLAALVIVSLGMMAVIQAVSETASNSSYLRDKTLAHWVALNRLTEARLEQSAPKVDETSDEVEMAGRTWRWTMTVTQTPVETMRRIDVSVRPADASEDSSMATLTGFYGSAIAPPGAAIVLWEGLGDTGRRGEPGDDEERQDEDDPPADEQEPPSEPAPDLEQDPGDLDPTDESL